MDWRDRLAGYLRQRLPAADDIAIVRVGGMPAGASNQTLAIDLRVVCDGVVADLPLVLRPERPDGILAPYDVGRQFQVLRALARTDVPVPPVAWYEPDAAVLGAPFFLMYRLKCETLPLFWYGGVSPRLSSAAAALATVHGVAWREAGLGFLLPGPPGTLPSPLGCELPAWKVRAARMGLTESPLLVALERQLIAHEPGDARHALIHGDPNPGNYLVRGDDVVAVVDWELASIGDARSDFGFYAALMDVFGGFPAEGGVTLLSEAYERVTGAALTALPYYEAWGLYRMLVVMSGWGGGGLGVYGQDGIRQRLTELLGAGWDS